MAGLLGRAGRLKTFAVLIGVAGLLWASSPHLATRMVVSWALSGQERGFYVKSIDRVIFGDRYLHICGSAVFGNHSRPHEFQVDIDPAVPGSVLNPEAIKEVCTFPATDPSIAIHELLNLSDPDLKSAAIANSVSNDRAVFWAEGSEGIEYRWPALQSQHDSPPAGRAVIYGPYADAPIWPLVLAPPAVVFDILTGPAGWVIWHYFLQHGEYVPRAMLWPWEESKPAN